MKSFSAASSTSASWPRKGWNSTWSVNTGATRRASRSSPAGKLDTPRCTISPSSRRPTSAPSVSSSPKSSLGQCRSRRSRRSTCRFWSDSSAARRSTSGAYSSRAILVVRKNSWRGTPAARARARPPSRCRRRARCRCAGSRSRARPRPPPGTRALRSARCRSRAWGRWCPGSRGRAWMRRSWSSRARTHPRPLASLPRVPRAISSAGRAPPRQGGGHWFEPSIAHSAAPAASGERDAVSGGSRERLGARRRVGPEGHGEELEAADLRAAQPVRDRFVGVPERLTLFGCRLQAEERPGDGREQHVAAAARGDLLDEQRRLLDRKAIELALRTSPWMPWPAPPPRPRWRASCVSLAPSRATSARRPAFAARSSRRLAWSIATPGASVARSRRRSAASAAR